MGAEGVCVEGGGGAHLELGRLHGSKQKGSRDGWEGSVLNDGSELGDALFVFEIGEGEAEMPCGAVTASEGEREGQS